MITDLFIDRYNDFRPAHIPVQLFVQFFNLIDDYNIGIRKQIVEKIDGYDYSGWVDELTRMIQQSQDKFCNEVGCKTLDKPTEYLSDAHRSPGYRILKNYTFDETIPPEDKLSLFEILFRDIENHLSEEVKSLEQAIPEYEEESNKIAELSASKGVNYHNEGEIKLKKAKPQLKQKITALDELVGIINKRLRQHNIEFTYHNGYFQKSNDKFIEDEIEKPFWDLLSNTKYENVEKDILQALDLLDSDGRDPAFYAAKALESMLKIVCIEKGVTKGGEKGAIAYVNHLNSKKNGSFILNEEKEELVQMFNIRNSHGHGPGSDQMINLNYWQVRRYISSCMVWIQTLAHR